MLVLLFDILLNVQNTDHLTIVITQRILSQFVMNELKGILMKRDNLCCSTIHQLHNIIYSTIVQENTIGYLYLKPLIFYSVL